MSLRWRRPDGGGMTWVDLAVFGFILISGLLAFARGLVREVLGIGAWVGAFAAAFFALPATRGIVRGWLPSPEWIDPVSFIIVFLVALIVLIADRAQHRPCRAQIGARRG